MTSTELIVKNGISERFLDGNLLPQEAFLNNGQSFDGEFTDGPALTAWLAFVSLRNAQTLRSYKTEALRFRIFMETIHKSDRDQKFLLRDATEMDFLLYEVHLTGSFKTGKEVDPLIVPNEILDRYGREDQPFSTKEELNGVSSFSPKKLKQSSANQALSILHALYQFWMRPDPNTKMAYVGANPVSRLKSSANRTPDQISRSFPMEAVLAMLASIDLQITLTSDDSKQLLAGLERRRWILALLFGLWGRRSEIARLKMNDFSHDVSANQWNVTVKRKGGKIETIPVADWVMQSMMRYRSSIEASPLPSKSDDSPAIARLRILDSKKLDTISNNIIYREVLIAAKDASGSLRNGFILPEMEAVQRELVASHLDNLSPHWFRHSGASIAINTGAISLENASKMLGHSTPGITAKMYYHRSDTQILEGMEKIGAKAFLS